MDHGDWELLDKQMRNLQPPRRGGGLMMLILAAAFLAGIAAGSSFLKAPQAAAQTVTEDGRTALAFFFDRGRSVTR
jgi:hypothetical protein